MEFDDTSLTNKLLIAMPGLGDIRFHKSVVYVCEHNSQGAVGLIINQPLEYPLSFVFDQMKMTVTHPKANEKPLLFGGPVEQERGFVIHDSQGDWRSSISLQDGVNVTTSNDILKALAQGAGPSHSLVALGYAGWGEQQLEDELKKNSWLVCPYDEDILYSLPFEQRWHQAAMNIGVNMNILSSDVGHA